MEKIVISLASLFFIGHALQWIFVKTKFPDLLILIIIGVIIGPSSLNLITHQHLGQVGTVLATVTLIIILYEGGLNLNASSLLKSSVPALFLSILSFLLIAGLTTACLTPFFTFPTSFAYWFRNWKHLFRNRLSDDKTLRFKRKDKNSFISRISFYRCFGYYFFSSRFGKFFKQKL